MRTEFGRRMVRGEEVALQLQGQTAWGKDF